MARARLAFSVCLALLLGQLSSPRLYFSTPLSRHSRGPAATSLHAGRAAAGRSPPPYPGSDLPAFAEQLSTFLGSGGFLPWKQAEALINDAARVVEREATLQRVQVPAGDHINVVGDVHGQLFDLLHLLDIHGVPGPENPYLFNGDFVDRGSFSLETLLVLLAWKVACPESVHLARGNHEAHSLNVVYGFLGEVVTKYGKQGAEAYAACQFLFDRLPLAHVINDEVFVVHGGLPRMPGVGMGEIEALDRVGASARSADETSDGILLLDLLWADPANGLGSGRSDRGGNTRTFGPDMTKHFCEKNNVDLIIRSHQMKEEGYEWEHGGRCLTVFSAPQYCDACNNQGAVVKLTQPQMGGRLQAEVTPFNAAQRPPFYVPAMVYSPYSMESQEYLSEDARLEIYRALKGLRR